MNPAESEEQLVLAHAERSDLRRQVSGPGAPMESPDDEKEAMSPTSEGVREEPTGSRRTTPSKSNAPCATPTRPFPALARTSSNIVATPERPSPTAGQVSLDAEPAAPEPIR